MYWLVSIVHSRKFLKFFSKLPQSAHWREFWLGTVPNILLAVNSLEWKEREIILPVTTTLRTSALPRLKWNGLEGSAVAPTGRCSSPLTERFQTSMSPGRPLLVLVPHSSLTLKVVYVEGDGGRELCYTVFFHLVKYCSARHSACGFHLFTWVADSGCVNCLMRQKALCL